MANSTLKSLALTGMLWSAADKFAVQGGQFVVSIVLARLLMPEDFGLIGMLAIFMAVSQSLIDSGMGRGLVQKKNRTEVDFSTVFVFNFFVSVAIYLALFFSAPLIARFYNTPELVSITRVLTLNIIINSLTLVPRARFTINIDFKSIAKVHVLSVFVSGLLAVYLAYAGFGVWALVLKTLLSAIVSVFVFWVLSKSKPSFRFSYESFKQLFNFGYKLLIAGISAQTLQNIYSVAIGRVYSAGELGFYTRAKNFAELTSGTITSILHQVTFPILTSLQDDRSRLISVYSRMLTMTAFFVFPAMTLLSLLAEPFILFLLTDKWVPAVVLLQWMSFARIVRPISAINLNILNAIGRSDLFLKIDLSKVPMVVVALIITIPMGVKAIVIGHVITSFLAYFVNAYMPGKLFGYGAISQIKDTFRIILATVVMAMIVFVLVSLTDNQLLKLIIGGISGTGSYILASYLLRIKELNEVRELAVKLTNRK